MTPGARCQAAIELLDAIFEAEVPADQFLSQWFRRRRYAGSGDRAAIRDIVYTVLRRRQQLDWWIARCGAEPGETRRRVLAALRLVAGWTPDAVSAAFDGGRYRPAPLDAAERRLLEALPEAGLDHPEQPLWVATNCPRWLEASLRRAFGAASGRELVALLDEAAVDLRANALKCSRERAIAALEADGIAARPTPLSPLGLRLIGRPRLDACAAFRDGLVEVQDEGSQLVALLVGARPGMRVADLCSGAGGKALALAAAMGNRGYVLATDVDAARLERAGMRLARAGATIVERRVLDDAGAVLAEEAGRFERVLVDAPCSRTGAWRRSPEARWRLTPKALARFVILQDQILDTAAPLVAPGGRLVYATCSLLVEENEDRVAAFLERHGDAFRLLPVACPWREALATPCPAQDTTLRLTPYRHGTDGFFVAILERRP